MPGSAAITTPDTSTTNVVVNDAQTVINWTTRRHRDRPSAIVFQPGGTTTNFMSARATVMPSSTASSPPTRHVQIQFVGTVNSLSSGSANGPVGGSIYFYAPGGFMLGGGSVFNVGSLVMSALPIAFMTPTALSSPARATRWSSARRPRPTATIRTNTGVRRSTRRNSGSYVALVAPRIVRNGDIDVNGQAAIVAAEAATIRFAPDGLFDIEVTFRHRANTSAITGGGDITGATTIRRSRDNHRSTWSPSQEPGDNLALSQGTNLGFEAAGSASLVDNVVVLSGGHDVIGGAIQTAPSLGGGTGVVNINANAINVLAATEARTTGAIAFFSLAGQSTNFAGTVTANALGNIILGATGSDASFTIGGLLTASTDRTIAAGSTGAASDITLQATDGGQFSAQFGANLSADATGASTAAPGVNGGAATGGDILVYADGGATMTIAGDLTASAYGSGGHKSGAGAGDAGAGTGGTISVYAGVGCRWSQSMVART